MSILTITPQTENEPLFTDRVDNYGNLIYPGRYQILIGGAENYDFIEHNDRYWHERRFWTVLKSTRMTETAFIYLRAPVSRIVGQVEIVGAPFYNVDRFTNWKNRWMAEVGRVVYFFPKEELTLRGLRRIFLDWPWLRYPRCNTMVPAAVLKPFMELMLDCDAAWTEQSLL